MMSQKAQTKRIRILVAKLGLDGHDRGALVLCRAFRDAGMEVIYSGLFATPQRIAQIAEDEDVDVVALSLLNGAHLTLFPRVVNALKEKKITDVLVMGGGVIPEDDKVELEKSGVLGNFGPGTPLPSIIEFIQSNISKSKKN
jgi:methylmalonyl-CoA mutase C-terminal domain/subunit